MALITQRPKGTQDVVPSEAYKWHTVEKLAAETAEAYGFKEIRFPVFEHTELFTRSVGDTTDVVQKEMYTFNDKGNRSITLRPEGTAGAARASIENGLLNDALPQKVYYIIPCFRYEKPQAGRLREFHQFGAEMYGSASPCADADIIAMAKGLIDRLGLKNIELFINSIGCPNCRAEYHKALKAYFENSKGDLCETCLGRLEKNPMRILDCKSPVCSKIAENAPVILDFLCDDCRKHFETLKKNLTAMGIEFKINPKIVRGLDYYTRTVFEFVTTDIGAQGTVCGGGRYDGLIEEMGGKPMPALGFAMGIERLILTMQSQECDFIPAKKCDLYIASMGERALEKAIILAKELRDDGYYAEYDVMGRGLKAQMKYADKIGATFTMVLGDNELETEKAKLKNMETGNETDIRLTDKFIDDFSNMVVEDMFDSVFDKIIPNN
jgi:histidyl-tRNA synthetase